MDSGHGFCLHDWSLKHRSSAVVAFEVHGGAECSHFRLQEPFSATWSQHALTQSIHGRLDQLAPIILSTHMARIMPALYHMACRTPGETGGKLREADDGGVT